MPCQFEPRRQEIINNLLDVYMQRTTADVDAGIMWYPTAQRIVREWSEHYHYSVDTVAAVIAALSPQLEWSRNLVIADDILAQRNPSVGGALFKNIAKAKLLRDDEGENQRWGECKLSLSERMTLTFPQGPKVTNFALNLTGEMQNAVTIDTHCAQAALNNPLSIIYLKWTPYRIFAECYAQTARQTEYTPATFQAIIWHVWKRLYPRVWKLQNRKQWHTMGEY